jgi:membrane associated rhomboid family serine protease
MIEEEKKTPKPFVTYTLLVVMILVHLYRSLVPPAEVIRLYETYSLFPVRFFDGIMLDNLLTYVFLHGNWVHLFANCISLFGAGTIVETDIGHLKFLIAFLTSGIVAGLFHSLFNLTSSVPIIGASGAIFGIIAILFLLMPFKITYTLMIPLPSVAVGLILSIIELYSFWVPTDLTIAHDAHIVGFVFGCFYAFIVDKRRALKGFIVALLVLGVLYYVGIVYGVI